MATILRDGKTRVVIDINRYEHHDYLRDSSLGYIKLFDAQISVRAGGYFGVGRWETTQARQA